MSRKGAAHIAKRGSLSNNLVDLMIVHDAPCTYLLGTFTVAAVDRPLSGRATRWQRSVSQSSDRWTTLR